MFGIICATTILSSFGIGGIPAVPDTPFQQEYREFYTVLGSSEANSVRAIAIDAQQRPWIATDAGIFRFDNSEWSLAIDGYYRGPAFAATSAPDGSVWIGAWNGLYRTTDSGWLERVPEITDPIATVGVSGELVVAMGPRGMWHNRGGAWNHVHGAWADSPRAVVFDHDESLWVPTGHGLFHIREDQVIGHLRDFDVIRSGELSTATIAPDGALWVGGNNGIDVYRDGARIASHTPQNGLPHPFVHSLDFAPDGTLWVGTDAGAARFDGAAWTLRHSRRWLPSDDVRDVAFDNQGTAWLATANGVCAIKQRTMTLAEKAAYFEDVLHKRHVRAPWLVEKCRLKTPGDLTVTYTEDDDNDGQYTNMYLAMEAFRYAATKNPEARDRAQKAFESMAFLQTVTNTSGFVARTVAPIAWTRPDNPNPHRFHDPNRSYSPQQRAEALVQDPRYKPVEIRWHPSKDGQWLWKGDTSSDEITGHFYGYLHYYMFVAQTQEEKQQVRDLCRRVMDYIIDGGYVLRDTDGEHTRWGVWSPEKLLHDPDWQAERSVNAVEILSYLKTTYHLTSDDKYQTEYRRLVDEFGYAELVRSPKPTNPSERTHIDSELLALAFPALLMCEDDPELLAAYKQGIRQWFGTVRHEYSPYYNFLSASLGIEDIGVEECIAFLRDAPLDLIRWTVDNTKREDLELVREPELEHLQTSVLPPPSERGVMRWDNNPWSAVQGDGGRTESSAVYWLLPYWMGRYYGFIEPPKNQE